MNAKSRDSKPEAASVFDVLDEGHREILTHLHKLAALAVALQTASPADDLPGEARALMAFFSGPAREHNYDEELHVFPALLESRDPKVKEAAEDLCEDHARIELCWLEVEPQLGLLAGGGAVRDVGGFCAAVTTFVDVTREHVALEESLIYPELRGQLEPTARRSIRHDMASRRRR